MENFSSELSWVKVSCGVITNDDVEHNYEVLLQDNDNEHVFIGGYGGELKVPIADLPLLSTAIDRFIQSNNN